MPIRQNILRKGKAPKQNLRSFDVFREETGVLGDLTTSQYFNISEFPSVLPTGNSSFLIEGSNLLKPNVELKTELLDAQGNPIFHYAIPYYNKELPARRIAIEIYTDDVVNGVGSFTVLGELDPTKTNVPTQFQDTYNVRFTAPITINKRIKNTQPIRFYGDPTITVSELVKGVIATETSTGQLDETITGSVQVDVTETITETAAPNNPFVGTSDNFNSVGNNTKKYFAKNFTESQPAIIEEPTIITTKDTRFTYVVKEMEKGTENDLNKITSAMGGATITFNNPHQLVDSTLYPDSKWTKPTTFETTIIEVINSTSFKTSENYFITSKTNNNKVYVSLNPTSNNVSITHKVQSVGEVENTVFKRSYANITVGNLQTFSGDTYKAKIYMKEDGTAGSFEPIYETLVASPNELIDVNSISGFKSVGVFNSQSIVDNYWVTSSNLSSATQNDDTIINGVLLSGSNAAYGSSYDFKINDIYSLQKNETYVVSFGVAFKPTDKTQSNGTSKREAKLEVFLTGSFVSTQDQELKLGEVDLTNYDFDTINDYTKVKQLQIIDFQTHNEFSLPSGSLGFRVHSGEFILNDVRLKPYSEQNFSPGFFKANVPMPKPIKRGQNYDFYVEFFDANNNKAEAVAIADNISFQGPPQVIADGLDATFSGSMTIGESMEMYGVNPAYLRTIGYRGFQHSIDNNLGGFMLFSGSIDSRITASEQSGFEYNGGVGLEVVDGGSAVDRYLRFRTQPSIFEVVTDTFFLGQNPASVPNGSFISGSNGILQISSSNFSVDASGNLTASGYISASGGHLGNFEIVDGKISGSNITMDANTSQIYKTDQGPGSDTGAAFDQLRDEYYIDFTPSGSGDPAGTEYYIKMGPNFMVDKDGILIASGAEFIGTITASAGLIGGFTTDSHSFSSTNIFISGSPAVGGVDSPEYMFISTSNFNVKQNGDVTGSSFLLSGGTITSDVTILGSVSANSILTPATIAGSPSNVGNASASIDQFGNAVFRSGSIGGFRIDSTTLFSDNAAFVVTGSTGQITGSQVLFTGGKIGGFELGESIISSSNGDLVLKSNGQITASNAELSGNLNAVHIKATSGSIGGWVLDTTELSGTNAVLKSSGVLSLGSGTDNYNQANRIYIDGANTRMSMGTGFKYASNALTIDGSATIGGWTINSSTITGGNLILRQDGVIETSNFVSGEKGFRLSAINNGTLEVEEATIRGTLKTTVFEKETVNAVGGQLVVANSTVITGSDVGKTDTTMSVVNVTGFEEDEILFIKKVSGSGFSKEFVQVGGSKRFFPSSDTDFSGELHVTRAYGTSAIFNPDLHSGSLSDTAGTGSSYTTGQVVVSTGKLNTGYIKLNANPNDPQTPFIDIVERTGSGVYDVDLKARLGDLSGLSSALVGSSPGFGLFSENVFLTGKITATSGEIGGFGISDSTVSSSNAQLILRDNGQITASNAELSGNLNATHINATSGSIGGFVITTNQIKSADGNITLNKDSKALLISDTTFGETGIQLQHNSGTPRAFIGKKTGGFFKFQNNDVEISSSAFILGASGSGAGAYVSASNGQLRISSSAFDLDDDGTFNFANGRLTFNGSTLAIAGTVTIGSTAASTIESNANSALQSGDNVSELTNNSGFQNASDVNTADKTDGTVGGWTIDSNAIYRGTELADDTFASSTGQITIGAGFIGAKEFKIASSGTATFKGTLSAPSGDIGGWTINSTNIEKDGVRLNAGSNNGYLGIGVTSYNTNNGIWIGETSSGLYQMSLKNSGGTKYFKWDGTNLEVDAGNFSLNSSGNITATSVNLTGTINATAGNIGGWSINSNDLVGGAVRLFQEGVIEATGSTSLTVGGVQDTTAQFSGSSNKGSIITIKRDDFGGSNQIDYVQMHTSQSYVDDVLLSYTSGSDRDDITFTAGTGTEANEIVVPSGTTNWGNIYLRAKGTGVNSKVCVLENSVTTNQLLDTGEDNLVTEIAFVGLSEGVVLGTANKSLFRWEGRVYQNDTNSTTGAELVQTFNISSLLSAVPPASQNININIPIVLNKRYFYMHIVGTTYDALSGNHDYKIQMNGSPVRAVKYIPKVITSGIGFQTFAGPNQNVKFGAKNEIVGDLTLRQTVASSRGNIAVQGKASVGTIAIDDTFDLYVDGEIGATGNITAYYSSDERLKENIIEIKDGLSLINQLRPVKFDWKVDSPFGHLYPTEYGLIAQEVEQVIPEIVGKMKGGYKGINYESLVPLLVQSIQELTERIEELEKDK